MSRRAHRRFVAVLLAVVALSSGCASDAAGDDPVVMVTTNILGDVVGELVGDEFEVVTLMPPNTDPHQFQVSAQQAQQMREVELLVSNGLGLEEGVQDSVDAAAQDGTPLFVAGDHVEVLDHAGGASQGSPDPHFWTDPARMVDVVDGLVPVLVAVDGVDADAIDAAAAAYRDELVRLDAEMDAAFSAIPDERRALVTNHHVFGYLAERFDVEVLGAIIPSGTTLASPSASDLRGLAEAVEAAGVPAIFAESSSNERLAQVLADEVDLEVDVVSLFSESLTEDDGDAPTYLTMMRTNTERITTGLTP